MRSVVAVLAYLGICLTCNLGFAYRSSLWWVFAFLVGFIFVIRDFCHREIGSRWMLVVQVGGGFLSLLTVGPAIAVASTSAFMISEGVDWGVFVATGRSMRDRILLSSLIAVPIDTAIYFAALGLLTPTIFIVQSLIKLLAAGLVWYRMPEEVVA